MALLPTDGVFCIAEVFCIEGVFCIVEEFCIAEEFCIVEEPIVPESLTGTVHLPGCKTTGLIYSSFVDDTGCSNVNLSGFS